MDEHRSNDRNGRLHDKIMNIRHGGFRYLDRRLRHIMLILSVELEREVFCRRNIEHTSSDKRQSFTVPFQHHRVVLDGKRTALQFFIARNRYRQLKLRQRIDLRGFRRDRNDGRHKRMGILDKNCRRRVCGIYRKPITIDRNDICK